MKAYFVAGNPAEELIKNYVINNLSVEDFKIILEQEKNINDCMNYIIEQVRKDAGNNRACCKTDGEVFSLAMHYFTESSIKKFDGKTSGTIKHHTQVIDEDDEEEIEVVKPVAKAKEVKPKAIKQSKPKGYEQVSLFDLLGE